MASVRRDCGREVIERLMASGTGFGQPPQCDAQVVIGVERIIDKLVECRIIKLLPELRLCLLRGEGGRLCRSKCCCGLCLRLLVVGPNGAAGKRGCDEERDCALQ